MMTVFFKRLLLPMLVVVLMVRGVALSNGIVNNDGDSSEDSVVVSVVNWDSAGCSPISADSFWVAVLKSGSDEVVFKDSGTASMEGLDTVMIGGKTVYYFHRSAADIDGAGSSGLYAGELIAKNSNLGLFGRARFAFQVVGWELDDMGDSSSLAAWLCDSAVIRAAVVDSVNAALDTLQNHDDWVSDFDAGVEDVALKAQEFASVADTIFGRDSNLYDEGYWHKIAIRADSGAGSGSGAYSFLLVAFDESLEQVIPSVSIAVRNPDQTSLLAAGVTNLSGAVSFNLDAGSYLAVGRAAGYTFEAYDTIVVSSAGVDTLFGYQFDPGAPLSPDLCRVYGHLHDIGGNPQAGAVVTAALPSGVVRFDGVIVSPASITTTTDGDGYFFLDLLPSDLLTPPGTVYEFTVSRSDGTILRQRAAVPDAETWCLTW